MTLDGGVNHLCLPIAPNNSEILGKKPDNILNRPKIQTNQNVRHTDKLQRWGSYHTSRMAMYSANCQTYPPGDRFEMGDSPIHVNRISDVIFIKAGFTIGPCHLQIVS